MNPATRTALLGKRFDPSQLFLNGEQGVWFDPSDLSTLYQDAAGTTPVTDVGQPVGKMLDKSGRGNHATQSTLANRPILLRDAIGHYYLACDGSVTSMLTGSIDFTGTDKITLWAAMTKLSDAALGFVMELSFNAGVNTGSFYLDAPNDAANMAFVSRGTSSSSAIAGSSYPAPLTAVLTGVGDIANDVAQLRCNGLVVASSTTDQGTGTYGNYALYLFRRNAASSPFNGRFFGAFIRGAVSNHQFIRGGERWLGAKSGITL